MYTTLTLYPIVGELASSPMEGTGRPTSGNFWLTFILNRIHYPLPLPYMGKPDPRALQETIRQLRQEIKMTKSQVRNTHIA